MTQQHPISPSPDLLRNWCQELNINGGRVDLLFIKAAQWGADQELEACLEWLEVPELNVDTYKLRTARRPKPLPLTLKEQSIALLDLIQGNEMSWQLEDLNVVRQALEQLPDDK